MEPTAKRAGLNREKVLRAALALTDRDGIEKLSMRRLGNELGVEAMTLYHHVPNKAALLDGLVELVVSAVRPGPGPDWRERLRGLAHSLREELLRHPGVIPLVATRPVRSPAGLRAVETTAAALVDAGFTPVAALRLVNAIATLVIGHCLAEAATTPGHPEPDTTGLDLADFPTLAAATAAGLGTPTDHEARFALALDAMLIGFPHP